MSVGLLDQVTQQFLQALQHDGAALEAAGKHLFYDLVIIQLAASSLWLVLTGETLERLFIRLVQLGISFGVFYTLVCRGGQWVPEVLNGFIELGQKGGVSALSPSAVIDQGLSIASAIVKGFEGMGLLGHPFISILAGWICLIIVVVYGFIAAELAIVLVKSYVLVALSGLFFAFGGSNSTSAMSLNYVRAIIAVGLNLMTLYLLLGVGQRLGSNWAQLSLSAAKNHELMPMLVIVAAMIVYHRIVKTVPAFVASLAGIGGLSHVGQETVQGAVRGGTTIVAALKVPARGVREVAKAGLGGKLPRSALTTTPQQPQAAHSRQASERFRAQNPSRFNNNNSKNSNPNQKG